MDLIRKHHFEDLLFIILIFIFTFVKFTPISGTGLDGSYMWALNWFYAYDYDTLIQISYPIGPLGFLIFPMAIGNNLVTGIIFYCVIKLIFIYLLFFLSYCIHSDRSLTTIPLIFIVSYFGFIDFSILASCIILIFLSIIRNNVWYFMAGIIISSLGLFMKSSIGIAGFSIAIISLPIIYWMYQNLKNIFICIAILIVTPALMGLIIFKWDVFLLKDYILSISIFSSVYSNMLTLHPDNNWWILGAFLLLIVLIPIIIKDLNLRIFSVLLLLPFFAMWKHSMIREDTVHYTMLIYFVIVYGIISLIITAKNKIILTGILLVAIMLLYYNMKNLPMYQGIHKEITGVNNFAKLFTLNDLKNDYKRTHQNSLSNKILPEYFTDLIGEKSIDIYPWELSYIAANKLNWMPRKRLTMGLDYSQYKSEGPEYILFHQEKGKYDNKLGSIDDRYLLNDEPEVTFKLLNYYSISAVSENLLLLKRGYKNIINHSEIQKISEFNKWIDVPSETEKIYRIKINSQLNVLGKIKKLIYKDEEYFIDYMFDDDYIITYRYLPYTAHEGLWLNPFVINTDLKKRVTKVRFRNSNNKLIDPEIKYQIESLITIKNKTLFTGKISQSPHVIYDNTFKDSFIINSGEFSPAFEFSLDTVWNKSENATYLLIESRLKVKITSSEAVYVITLTGSENDFWHSQKVIDTSSEDYIYSSKILNRKLHRSGIIKVYVFNSGVHSTPTLIENFRASITAYPN